MGEDFDFALLELEIAEAEVAVKGGPGSGHHGHGGRPGQRGGSAPGSGTHATSSSGVLAPPEVHSPSGTTREDARDAARFIVHHMPGEEPPESVAGLLDELVLSPKYSNYGEWAEDTLRITEPEYLAGQVDFITAEDVGLMQKMGTDMPWVNHRVDVEIVNDIEPDLGKIEQEWGISPHAIVPYIVAGKWEYILGRGFVISISRLADNKRSVFWHELGHITPNHVIVDMIGEPRPGENTGDYIDRFAAEMVKRGQG